MSQNRYEGCHPYLVKRVRYHAQKLQHHAAFHYTECADLEQELMLFFLSREHTYNPSQASWRTFVSTVVHCGSQRLIRDALAQKHGFEFIHVSLDDMLLEEFMGCDDTLLPEIQSGSRAHCELCCDLQHIVKKLPMDLARLLQHMQTLSLKDIARHTNTTYLKRYHQLTQLRAALKQFGLEINK